jgi:hypothetical protein
VRTAGDCYRDETVRAGTVAAQWTDDPPGSSAGDVVPVDYVGVGVAVVAGPVLGEVAGVGVWLGVCVTPGVGE